MGTKPIELKYLPQVLEGFCWLWVVLVWVCRDGLVGSFLCVVVLLLHYLDKSLLKMFLVCRSVLKGFVSKNITVLVLGHIWQSYFFKSKANRFFLETVYSPV